MDSPLRRSRRLGGLRPVSPEGAASVLRVRRALVGAESGPGGLTESGAPQSPRQPDPGSPQSPRQPDPGSPQSPRQPDPGSPQIPRQPDPGSPQPRQQEDPGMESPRRPPEPSPGPPARVREGQAAPRQQPGPGRPEPTGGRGAARPKGAAAKRFEKDPVPVIPKGKPKSGRVWKDPAKKRFSHMVQDKPLRTSWRQKMRERQERKMVRDFARHLEEEKARRREEKKQRRAENLRRRLENEQRAEVVQVIRNPAKLKRAKKRQLRSVQKRDTLLALQKQPPRQLQAEPGPPGFSGDTGQGPP